MDNVKDQVEWRKSTYKLVKVEGDEVQWYNPVSRHYDVCSVESWNRGEPYGDKQLGGNL